MSIVIAVCSAFANAAIVGVATRRMLAKHTAALRQMQKALWNDRQLRLGKSPEKVVSGE